MSWACILDFLKTYQTIVAGLLALGGVAIGLRWNSHIAQRERRAKILHDKQSLRVALLEELRKLKESMVFRDEDLEKATTSVYALSDDPLTSLFRASISNLGLMPEQVLRPVLQAYLSAEHLPKNLRLLQHENTPADLSVHFIVISSESYEFVRGMHREQGERIRTAVDALEQWVPTA